MCLGPGSIGLDHRGIAETVDHHTGQAIRLGMDQAIVGGVEQAFPQIQRTRQPRRKPVLIDHRLGVAVEHPGDDLRFHIDCNKAERPPLAILQHGKGAGGQRLGAPVGDQLIRVDPRKAMANGAGLGLGFEADNLAQVGRGHIGHGRGSCGPADTSP